MKSTIMGLGISQADKETRTGVLLVLALVIGSMLVGMAMHHFWQRYALEEAAISKQSRYFSLGQHSMAINGGAIIMKLSLEYVGQETEQALAHAMPRVNGAVLRRIAQIQPADLPTLRTAEGKQALARDLLEKARQALDGGNLASNVKGVLFEKFLINS